MESPRPARRFFLNRPHATGFYFPMLLAALTQAAAPDPYYGYPPWLVVAVGALVAALLLWIFGKLVKWMIWVLIIIVLAGGLITAGRMLLQ